MFLVLLHHQNWIRLMNECGLFGEISRLLVGEAGENEEGTNSTPPPWTPEEEVSGETGAAAELLLLLFVLLWFGKLEEWCAVAAAAACSGIGLGGDKPGGRRTGLNLPSEGNCIWEDPRPVEPVLLNAPTNNNTTTKTKQNEKNYRTSRELCSWWFITIAHHSNRRRKPPPKISPLTFTLLHFSSIHTCFLLDYS